MSGPDASSQPDGLVGLRPDWPAPPNVQAVFTLRRGGVSLAPYASLNLGAHVDDDPVAVATNRGRIRAAFALPGEPAWLSQVHGSGVARLAVAHDPLPEPPTRPEADGVVTSMAGRVCVIQVADCLPILFTARDGSVVGAAHAGWRGLAAGIVENTVRALGVEASQLLAWIGPGISQSHFEVGSEVRDAFITGADAHPPAAAAFVRNARGRWQCDLCALVRQRLAVLGVTRVHGGSWCTFADAARFFSHRRDGQSGRMAALIWRA